MRTVSAASVAAGHERIEELPSSVQEALGELAGVAKEGLLALSVGVGLGVLHELMEAEVCEVVGPKGRHISDRAAVRHGHEGGEVTLGGRRVPVSRPRARSADGEREVELGTYANFVARDRLSDVMLERMLAGVSTRRYARTGEPVGAEIDTISRSTSKSAVSREFVSRTREHLKSIFDKTGVRSRRELVFAILQAHYLPRAMTRQPVGPSGFFAERGDRRMNRRFRLRESEMGASPSSSRRRSPARGAATHPQSTAAPTR